MPTGDTMVLKIFSCVLTLWMCLGVRSFAANTGEMELTRAGETSIQMHLQFLAKTQREDGSSGSHATASTAAAVLAWMCAGNLPGEGPYGKNVSKGIDYILNSAQSSGFLFKGLGGSMYHHAMATLCLAEAWGQSLDKRMYDKLRRAVDLIVQIQNDKGGWHYKPNSHNGDDLSVVVMQLVALRAAKDAGIAVPKEIIDRAIEYVTSCRTKKDAEGLSGFSYVPRGEKRFAMTAAGLMSLMVCGNYKAKDLKDGLDYLVKAHERKQDDGNHFLYGQYYAAQAMYQAGGQGDKFHAYWQKWYPDISQTIIEKQTKTGINCGNYEIRDGLMPWTVLILGIPYRYLPIYQR